MKHIADRNYKDLKLKMYVNKGDILEDLYQKAGIELTEDRANYLINTRKLFTEDKEEKTEEDKIDIIEEDKTNIIEEDKIDDSEIKTSKTKNKRGAKAKIEEKELEEMKSSEEEKTEDKDVNKEVAE